MKPAFEAVQFQEGSEGRGGGPKALFLWLKLRFGGVKTLKVYTYKRQVARPDAQRYGPYKREIARLVSEIYKLT